MAFESLGICHLDADRDERVLDHEQRDLDKAQEAHAEKQVQVAADGADQVVDGELGLLFHLLIGERVQVEDEPNQVLLFVVDVVGLVGAERAEDRVGAERVVGVELRGWKDER